MPPPSPPSSPVPTHNLYILGGHRATNTNFIQRYNAADETWTTLAESPEQRARFGVVAIGEKLYMGGGNAADAWRPTFDEYDIATDTWTRHGSMPNDRQAYNGAAVLQGKVCMVGGHFDQTGADCWDPSTEAWSALPDLAYERHSAGVVAYDGQIYVAGAWSGEGGTKPEVYDPLTDSWTIREDLTTANTQVGFLMESGGSLFLISQHDKTLVKHTKGQAGWTTLASVPCFTHNGVCQPRNQFCATAVGTNIYVAGGFVSGMEYNCVGDSCMDNVINDLQVYDTLTDTWSTAATTLPAVNRNDCRLIAA